LKTKRQNEDHLKEKTDLKDQTADTRSTDTVRHLDAPLVTNQSGLQSLIRQLGGPFMATVLLTIALLVIGIGAWSLTGNSNPGIKPGESLATDQKSDTLTGQKPTVQQEKSTSRPAPPVTSVKADNTQPVSGNQQRTRLPEAQTTKIDENKGSTTIDPEPATLPVIKTCPVIINTGGKNGLRVFFNIGGKDYDATSTGAAKLTFHIPCTFKDSSPKVFFEYNGKTVSINPKLSGTINAPKGLYE